VIVGNRYPWAAYRLITCSSSVRFPEPVPMSFSFSTT
jgi:hypothetical protein